MKNKSAVILLYTLQAIPIPISLFSVFGSLISLANITMMTEVATVFAVITMLLAGTYSITYGLSLAATLKATKLRVYSFAPLMHIVITVLFVCLWGYADSL